MTRFLSTIIEEQLLRKPQQKRNYISASMIGSPCERQIWYSYKGVIGEHTSPKQQMTFEIGRYMEALIISQLELSGLLLTNLWEVKDKSVKGFRGHPDAIWLMDDGDKAIIQIKSAKDSSFKIFVNKGLRAWYPKYYSQVQTYMGLSGIKQCYLICVNKDTGELHDELVPFDEMHYEELKAKAKRIIGAYIEPDKINQNPCYFMCVGCEFKRICHQ